MPPQAAPQFRLTRADIQDAFVREEFRLVFQPKVDLTTHEILGVEAFVRWQHPRFGLLPPGLFLDFIEQEKHAGDLTYFVIAKGIEAAARWRQTGKTWSLSLNVSPSDLAEEEFCVNLLSLARKSGVPASAIVIEAPERALAEDAETILATLDDLRVSGFQVALDGGGVVPVDLTRYQPVPFTSIKVGGQAMLRLAERLGLQGAGAISARLRFAQAEGLEAVAVGAESETTLARLKACGFTAAQGIWIQRPMPIDDLIAWNGEWVKGTSAPAFAEKPLAVTAAAVAAEEPVTQAPQPAPEAKPKRTRLPVDVLQKLRATEAAAPLLDVVEEVEQPVVRRAGLAQKAEGEACLPMAHLVERKPKIQDGLTLRGSGARKSSILDPMFT